MKKKKLGVLGGMGPKATSIYYERVIANTVAEKDQDHIDMVILNHASLPDRTDIILNKKEDLFLNLIEKDIRLLEVAEVDNIALTCNTAHFLYDQIQEMTQINVINMVRETVKQIYKKFGPNAKVGLLATDGTIQSRTYQNACLDHGLIPYIPNEVNQKKVVDIIYNDVKANMDVDNSKLEALIHELVTTEGCDCVILACTELSCIELTEETKRFAFDSMDALVKRSIEISGGKMKEIISNK